MENKISLRSILEYDELKILKMDYRPKAIDIKELPMVINKRVPTMKPKYKFLISYYLGNMVRSLVLSNLYLSNSNDSI
jgi:hypothetical protein